MKADYKDINKFWFEESESKDWFVKNTEYDNKIIQRFLMVHKAVTQGECVHWREQAEGRLAEIIVLDQFSRNMFRNTAQAFAYDGQALVLAQEAIRVGDDTKLAPVQQAFLYMPFMHSESGLIHKQAVELFNQPGMENNYKYELAHKAIIDQYGRYPHRNEVLGRESTPEEIEFLAKPGSSF